MSLFAVFWLICPAAYSLPKRAPGPGTTFNVKNYGATGDGVHDDSAAIFATITKANAQPGSTVFFPPNGIYVIGSPLVLLLGATLFLLFTTMMRHGQILLACRLLSQECQVDRRLGFLSASRALRNW